MRKKWHFRIILIALLCILCGAALYLLSEDLRSFWRNGTLMPQYRPHQLLELLQRTQDGTLSATSSVIYIQSWMTFDYLNKVFHLPKTYLQTNLNIQDARYPNISIRQYARDVGIDFLTAVDRVKTLILEEVSRPKS